MATEKQRATKAFVNYFDRSGPEPTLRGFYEACEQVFVAGWLRGRKAKETVSSEQPKKQPRRKFHYVEVKTSDGYWVRSAVGFMWQLKKDAQRQLRDLRKRNPGHKYRLALR